MPESRQSRRDIFLGAGAAALAIGCLAAFVELITRDRLASSVAPLANNASYGLRLVAYLTLAAGLSILAVALLTPRRRARRWRAGAFVLAAGCAALFFSDLISTVSVLTSAPLPGYSPAGVAAALIILLAVNLWFVAAAMIVAPLFRASSSPAGSEGSRPNARLAWAMLGFVVIFAAALVNEMVTGHRFWDSSRGLSGVNNVGLVGMAATILLFAAAAIAAFALRAAAASSEDKKSDVLRRREARLATAAACLLVSALLLFEVVFAAAAFLTFVGFAASRRSLSDAIDAIDMRPLKPSDPALPD
jgi:hypothetical protein